MAYPKEFSVVLFILLVAMCAYLLLVGRLSGAAFVTSLFVSALAVGVIHNLEVVQRLQVKGGSVEATADFERIRKDIYAKAEEVRHLTEMVAGMIAESVATSNRYGGSGNPDPVAQEVRVRDKLRQTLADGGTSAQQREELLAPFAKWIPFDLRFAILQKTMDINRQKGMTGKQINDFYAKVQTALEEVPPTKGLDHAVQVLREAGVSSSDLEEDINRYRVFLTEDRVPPLSSKR